MYKISAISSDGQNYSTCRSTDRQSKELIRHLEDLGYKDIGMIRLSSSEIYHLKHDLPEKIDKFLSKQSKFGLWDSFVDYGAAVGESQRLRKLGWQAKIAEANTPQGKKYRVWTTTKKKV